MLPARNGKDNGWGSALSLVGSIVRSKFPSITRLQLLQVFFWHVQQRVDRNHVTSARHVGFLPNEYAAYDNFTSTKGVIWKLPFRF
jgi:hypothetical protein